MEIVTLETESPLGNLNYILVDKKDSTAYIIDPFDAIQIMSKIDELGMEENIILLTHSHRDHIYGVEEIVSKRNLKIWGHRDVTEFAVDHELKEGDEIDISFGKIEILEVPGHRREHIVFYIQLENGEKHLVSGDTLFFAGVGNCTNGGNPEELYHSIQKIKQTIDPKTVIYPGHDYLVTNLKFSLSVAPSNVYAKDYLNKALEGKVMVPTKIENELKFNPFLRLDDPEVIEATGGKDVDEKQRFVNLRKLRDQW